MNRDGDNPKRRRLNLIHSAITSRNRDLSSANIWTCDSARGISEFGWQLDFNRRTPQAVDAEWSEVHVLSGWHFLLGKSLQRGRHFQVHFRVSFQCLRRRPGAGPVSCQWTPYCVDFIVASNKVVPPNDSQVGEHSSNNFGLEGIQLLGAAF